LADVAAVRAELFEQAADVARPLDEQTIVGYGLVRDVYGDPVLVERVESQRAIYAQGQHSIGYFSLALVVVGLLFGGVMLLLVEQVVLARVIRLSSNVRTVGISGNPSARVAITGRDELYDLGTSVNTMLDALEWANAQRQQSEAERLAALEQINAQQQALVAQLQATLAERENVERLKNEFISVVSHELRTPLTSIRGSLGLLAGGVAGDMPPAASTMVEIAYNNSERLVRLINDILDAEKIESGMLQLDIQPIGLRELLTQVIEENRGYGLPFEVTIVLVRPVDNLQILADRDRLRQVMANLISNAAKYSPAGGAVHIRAARYNHGLRIQVIDTGAGIPEAFRDRIFQKFAQADSSDTRQKGGTGLGLNISKALVEQMGGQIGFTSTPGVGTTFFLDLNVYEPGAATLACA
jgi:signal transduction histidine kinase